MQIEKSIHGVLGIQTRGADETMELWRPPQKDFIKSAGINWICATSIDAPLNLLLIRMLIRYICDIISILYLLLYIIIIYHIIYIIYIIYYIILLYYQLLLLLSIILYL